MVNYANGKIYKIVSNQTTQCYIGSTCQTLAQRMTVHRNHYRMYLKNKYHFTTAFNILKHPDAVIVWLENYPCGSKDELFARERHHIETTEACVNKCIPGRTLAEYRENNRGVIRERGRQFYAVNRETIRKKGKERITCQCGAQITRDSMSEHKTSGKHIKKMEELASAENAAD